MFIDNIFRVLFAYLKFFYEFCIKVVYTNKIIKYDA